MSLLFKTSVGISFVITFICLFVLFQDAGEYTYCVEWDGWIHRDNMIFNCYDFATQTKTCDYLIDGDILKVRLVTHNLTGDEIINTYTCTQWLKSKR